jgi:hypothetical protein
MSRYVSLARKVFRPNSAVFRVSGQVTGIKFAAPLGFKSFATDSHAHTAGKDEVLLNCYLLANLLILSFVDSHFWMSNKSLTEFWK